MVMAQRKALEKSGGNITTDQLFKFYDGITWATTSEKVTKNLLENASAINKWKECEQIDCLNIVKKSGEMYGIAGPFPSVLSIYLICSKANKKLRMVVRDDLGPVPGQGAHP